jgi:putative transposase
MLKSTPKSRKLTLGGIAIGILAVQTNGPGEVPGPRLWFRSFINYDLGYFDDTECRLEPLNNPFGSKLLPMPSE